MLSQALKGSASSSSSSNLLATSSISHQSTSLLDCSFFSSPAEALSLHVSVDDDSLDTQQYTKSQEEQDEEEQEPFWTVSGLTDSSAEPSPFAQTSGLDALCRSFVASSLSHRPPLVHANSNGGIEISAANNTSSNNSSPFGGMVARSCPKPILMPRRSRQGSLNNHDELTVFVPPHELAASSLLDPTNVSDSLCRKGSAAIRLRSGVLRRTGFLEGHTETLKPQTSVTSFRQ